MDDYFYPYKIVGEEFPDEKAFDKEPRQFKDKDDWRRDNVDLIIKQIRDSEHTIILEIDPLINELTVRRLQFYERAGFTLTPYRFMHLPYRLDGAPQELLILSYPQMITKEQHNDFLNFINNQVRNYCEIATS